jgi:type I restriction enzyme S subunit
MANNIAVKISKIKTEGRFNPKYYHFLNDSEDLIEKSAHKFVRLGNKNFFPILSDGIHTAVELLPRGDIKYLYIHNLKEGFLDTVDSNFISEIDNEKNKNKELKNGAVLLSVVGTLGNTALFSSYFNYRCSLPRNIAYVYCNEEKILPEFLTCFFLSEFSKYQCIYSGGGNIQGLLSLTKLKKFIVPNVDNSIQLKFARKYKTAIDLQEKFLESINECKSLFYEKLNITKSKLKKDVSFKTLVKSLQEQNTWTPITYDPFGEKYLHSIEDKFDLEELKVHINQFKGEEIGSANYLSYLDKKKDSIPFLRTSDIFNYELDSYPDFYCDRSFKEDLKTDIEPYDIAFTKDGSIGNLALITKEDDCILSSGYAIMRMKPSSKLNPFYIFLALSLKEIGQYQANKRTVIASTIPHLRPQNIYKIKIPIIDENSIELISKKVEYAIGLIELKKKIIKEIKMEMNKLLKI